MKFSSTITHGVIRINYFMVIFLIVIVFGVVDQARAQLGLLLGGRRPIVLETRYDYFDQQEQHQVMGTFARIAPLGRKGGSPWSHLTTLNLAAGYRFNADTSQVRWKIALLDGNIQRKNMLVGLTVFDFDESGKLEENYRWFAARLGPVFRVRAGKVAAFFNGVGEIGQSRMVLGQTNYGELGHAADSTLVGLQAGFRVNAAISVGRKILLSGGYGEKVLVDAYEPRFRQATAGLTVQLAKSKKMTARFFADYLWEEVDVNDLDISINNQVVRAGVSFLLIPQRRRSQFDDF